MRQSYCIKQECLRKAQGAFLLAHKLGLLETPSMEGFEARRQAHNRMLKKLEQELDPLEDLYELIRRIRSSMDRIIFQLRPICSMS